jgi:MFS family permease
MLTSAILALASPSDGPQMTIFRVYLLVVLGILISIVLPMLRRLLPETGVALTLTTFWQAIKPYVGIGAVSIVAAVLVLAFAGEAAKSWSWQSALLAGYAWDSTLQKVGKS